MHGMGLLQALGNGGFQRLKVGMVLGIEAVLFDKLPQQFDQIQVGRIGRQKKQLDVEQSGQLLHQGTALIACIIHHQGHWLFQGQGGQAPQQFTDTDGINILKSDRFYGLNS